MIGVAISTHRRPDILAQALAGWAKHMPDILIVNHDANGEGVAATKNRGIADLMDAGCQHLFLADDDMWPIAAWAHHYTDDPEPHLAHCWGRSRLLTDDGHYTTWSWPRGVLLYAHRTVIETIGGMRRDFGPRAGGEHCEWQRRIHNAGLTRHPFQDLTAARTGIWHCLDYTRRHNSTIGAQALAANADRRRDLYHKYKRTSDYVDYR